MSLTSILQEIKKIKPYAEENTDEGPTETLSNRRGRKNQSKERIKQLKKEYIREVLKNVVFIVSTGSDKETFAMIATEKFGCFNVDTEILYSDLADSIAPVLYAGKDANSGLFDTIGRYLEDKALDLDITGYPQIIFKQQYRGLIKDKEALQNLIRRVINEQVGSELVGINAINSIVDEAIEKEFDGSIVPIILSTDDADLITALSKDLKRLNKNVFTVISGKTTKTVRSIKGAISLKSSNEDTVTSALTDIRKVVLGK